MLYIFKYNIHHRALLTRDCPNTDGGVNQLTNNIMMYVPLIIVLYTCNNWYKLPINNTLIKRLAVTVFF